MPSTLHIVTTFHEGKEVADDQQILDADCGHKVVANPHTQVLLSRPGPHRIICIDCLNAGRLP